MTQTKRAPKGRVRYPKIGEIWALEQFDDTAQTKTIFEYGVWVSDQRDESWVLGMAVTAMEAESLADGEDYHCTKPVKTPVCRSGWERLYKAGRLTYIGKL